MKISVIICTFNRCESLRKVLACIEELVVPAEVTWEVLVVDNNSRDHTRDVVESFITRAPERFKYLFEKQQGKAFALNAGLRAARGGIVAFTDDDVLIDRNWLSEILAAFHNYDCSGVGGIIVPVWAQRKPKWYATEGPFRVIGPIVEYDRGGEVCEITKPPCPWGANMAFMSDLFEKYGFFRTDLGPNPFNLMRGEDNEFGLRLIQGKERFLYVPGAVVYHPVDANRAKKRYFKSWYFNIGRASVRIHGLPSNVKYSVGVPRFYFRRLVENWMRWGMAFNSHARFYHKMCFYKSLGELVETHYQFQKSRRSPLRERWPHMEEASQKSETTLR
jgi:glycosyltransferase involved in cell wall biosynthesis